MDNIRNEKNVSKDDYDKKTKGNDYASAISGLKDDVKSLTIQLKHLAAEGKHNEYISCLKALKETLNLIHQYDWQDQYSKYRTGSDSHLEVATWKQNSDGDIKDYHHYEVNNESGSKEFKELEKALNDAGISTRIDNTFRPINDVLNDINSMWRKFDDDFQKDFSHMFAGTRMKNTISALMDHYDSL